MTKEEQEAQRMRIQKEQFRKREIKRLEDKARAIYDELKLIRKQRNGSND